jgi:hypothetical protein
MLKSSKRILIFSVVLIVLAVYFVPPLLRYYRYYKFVISSSRVANSEGEIFEGSVLNTLSLIPLEIKLDHLSSEAVFSLGYAVVCIDQNEIQEIKVRNASIDVKGDKYSILFRPPFEAVKTTDLALEHSYDKRAVLKILPDDPFDAEVKIAQTLPKTFFQICFMSSEEFGGYMTRCFLKTVDRFNQKGIGIFETDNIKGLLGFGDASRPQQMLAMVFSKNSAVSQGIIVTSDSPERTKDIMFSLLSSYTYLIEEPPDEPTLNKLISDALDPNVLPIVN